MRAQCSSCVAGQDRVDRVVVPPKHMGLDATEPVMVLCKRTRSGANSHDAINGAALQPAMSGTIKQRRRHRRHPQPVPPAPPRAVFEGDQLLDPGASLHGPIAASIHISMDNVPQPALCCTASSMRAGRRTPRALQPATRDAFAQGAAQPVPPRSSDHCFGLAARLLSDKHDPVDLDDLAPFPEWDVVTNADNTVYDEDQERGGILRMESDLEFLLRKTSSLQLDQEQA